MNIYKQPLNTRAAFLILRHQYFNVLQDEQTHFIKENGLGNVKSSLF